jgi:hypothetical protein
VKEINQLKNDLETWRDRRALYRARPLEIFRLDPLKTYLNGYCSPRRGKYVVKAITDQRNRRCSTIFEGRQPTDLREAIGETDPQLVQSGTHRKKASWQSIRYTTTPSRLLHATQNANQPHYTIEEIHSQYYICQLEVLVTLSKGNT